MTVGARHAPLEGNAALITGGGGGIGRATALRLARDGAAVTLMGRTHTTLRAASDNIRASFPNSRIHEVVGDATLPGDIERAVREADEFGALRICVATVGGGTLAPVLLLDTETFENDIRRNVSSALLAIQYCGPVMAQRSAGSIVCISSSAGGFSFPFMASYSISKAALEALVRVAADEYGAFNVRVNAVRPGLTPTDSDLANRLIQNEQSLAAVMREKPLSRIGSIVDIVEGIRYLAGPESSWVTGVCLPIEGGNHLRRAPYIESRARQVWGDRTIDAVLEGRRLAGD